VDIIYLLSGLLILGLAGEATLRGAVGLAHRLNISPAVIGLTVIGFGTSLPELVVCVQAVLDGKPDLATGNIVGSNIANMLLILGMGALIFPLVCDPRSIRRDGIAMMLATVFCAILSVLGEIRPWIGITMLVTLVIYLGWSFKHDSSTPDVAAELHKKVAKDLPKAPTQISANLIYIIIGLVGLTSGAALLIEGSTGIARAFSVPESIIGLTMIALGTSLPELFATVIAALRRHGDVAVGTVIGSNLFNILGTLGATAAIGPLTFAADISSIDVWVMLGVTVVALKLMITGWSVSRIEGAFLLCAYVVYLGSLTVRGIINI
jgi:cation:H+ antiporter